MFYLPDVGRGGERELLPADVEGHVRHLANVAAADGKLRGNGAIRKMKENDGNVCCCIAYI